MRTVVFMSRMLGTVVVMVGLLLAVFIVLDVMRIGPNSRGFILGSDLWQQLRHLAEALF